MSKYKPLIISNKKKTILEVLVDLLKNKNLILQLTIKDLKSSFAQSILGASYFVISPLLQSVVLTFFVEIVIKKGELNWNSFYFFLVSMTIWNFFFNIVSKSSALFMVNRKYLVKLYFNRLALFVSAANVCLLTFFINLVIVIIFGYLIWFLYDFNYSFNLKFLFIVPLLILLIFFSSGLGLIMASLSIRYRDIIYGIAYILQLIFFMTPAVVTLEEFSGGLKTFFLINPITGALEVFRWIFIDGYNANFEFLLFNVISAISIIFLGLWLFNISDKKLADLI